MRININSDFPIYLNPTFEELIELNTRGWDTLRILMNEDQFVVGSGYGNTHASLATALRTHLQVRRAPAMDAYIMHYVHSEYYLDADGFEKVKLHRALRTVPAIWRQTINDICNLRETT